MYPSLDLGHRWPILGLRRRSDSEATADGRSDSETTAELVSEGAAEDGGQNVSESELFGVE